MNNKGFTLIELMVAFCIIGIFAAIFFGSTHRSEDMQSEPQVETYPTPVVPPVPETPLEPQTKCIDGYKFIINIDGKATQIISEMGHGVAC